MRARKRPATTNSLPPTRAPPTVAEPSPTTGAEQEQTLADSRRARVCKRPNGGGDGDRTHYLLHAMQALYQLSYAPVGEPRYQPGRGDARPVASARMADDEFRRSATPPLSPTRSSTSGRTVGTTTTSSTRPTAPACSSDDPRHIAGRPSLFVLDMFPYPSGVGLHVGHPLGFIATDVYARFQRMNGFNVLHAMGYDAFGLPAEQYAVQTGTHPRITTEQNIATMKRQFRALGLGHDPRRGPATTDVALLPLDAVDLPADLQLLVRRRRGPGASDRHAGTGVPRRPLRHARRRSVRRARCARAACARRLVPPGVRSLRAGQLVPGSRHGARQRRGHRRRSERARQLPGVSPAAEAVDVAHHRLRRPPPRRSRRARLDRLHQVDAAQLDRSLDGRVGAVRGREPRRRRYRGVHHPPRHPVRRHLHGVGARAPAGRRHHRRTNGPTTSSANDFASNALDAWKGLFGATDPPPDAVTRYREFAAAQDRSRTPDRDARRRPGSSSVRSRSTPPTTPASRSSSPTTC